MRRIVVAVPLAAVILAAWLAPPAAAQDTKSARGTVTAVAGNAVTVKAGERELTFLVDSTTTIVAPGAGTATRAAAAAGRGGPALGELIKSGQAVEVVFRESGGELHAERIRRVASAGRGTTSDDEEETSTGSVETVTASSLTISGSSGGGATFKQTFTIDTGTKVIGVGAGTASAAAGGRLQITDYVATGDRVTVWYAKKGDALHATEVRVRTKAK